MKNSGRLMGALVLTFVLPAILWPWRANDPTPAPRERLIVRAAHRVPGRYLVVLKDNADPATVATEIAGAHGGSIGSIYAHSLNGFSIDMSDDAALAVNRDPRVRYVEEDGLVSMAATQTNAPWGLDRIDQRDLPLNATFNYSVTGAGVNAYIIDSGIRASHTDLGGRVSLGFDAVGDGQNGDDCHGHGTHVAGIVGGQTYGVAKSVSLIAVRVLNCQGVGTVAQALAGVDWVTANHVKPALATMDFTGNGSTSLDTAVQNSANAGVIHVVAAGNLESGGQQDACNYSPGRAPSALTVGATDANDREATFSNAGSCVDLLAPGVNISSLWNTNNSATRTMSGTSMAAAHVAGAVALYLETNPGASPSQVEQAIETNATPNKLVVTNTLTPNLLLYTANFGNGAPPNSPPTASFTFTCTNLTCGFDGTGSSDSDGTIATYQWSFGDASTGSGPTASHTYASSGSYVVTLTITDNAGATAGTSKSITVVSGRDTTPPSIRRLTASPSVLWPPNHKMVAATVGVTVDDDTDPAPACRISGVASSEPVDGLGDGDTAPDWNITGLLTVQLRAERSAKGRGRTYTISVTCRDASVNTSSSSVTVFVPLNAR